MEPHVPVETNTFRHEALLYSNREEFLAGTIPFLKEGVSAGEAILVVEPADKLQLIREELGGEGDAVLFADMSEVGANPALIIPAWREFTERHRLEGRAMRGIGEPIFAGRRPPVLLECQRHEALLNLAFDHGVPWSLLCPYDTSVFGPAVINEARRSHPFVREGTSLRVNGDRGIGSWAAPYDAPLPEPPAANRSLAVSVEALGAARRLVEGEARRAGLGTARAADLVLAVNEVATNALRHGAEPVELRVWQADGALVCEVTDAGRYDRPLADRSRPGRDANAGRGLWAANHLCDLVQIHSRHSGTTVRLHVWMEHAAAG